MNDIPEPRLDPEDDEKLTDAECGHDIFAYDPDYEAIDTGKFWLDDGTGNDKTNCLACFIEYMQKWVEKDPYLFADLAGIKYERYYRRTELY